MTRQTAHNYPCAMPIATEQLDSNWSRTFDSGSDCSSSSESDSDSDYSADGYVLPEDHRLQSQRPAILQVTYRCFKEWSIGAKYHYPRGSRSRTSRQRPEFPSSGDSTEAGFVLISKLRHPMRWFHLACPWYARDPARHQDCLLQYSQPSIEGLICHIKNHHAKPLYCPICGETFDTAIQCDNHVLMNTCELRDLAPMDGIDQYHIAKLARRDKPHRDDARRWQRIWRSAFPDQEPPRSPYLDRGCGLAVAMARDFWEACGWQCVVELLESLAMLNGDDDEGAQDALCELALEDLLGKIMKEYKSGPGA